MAYRVEQGKIEHSVVERVVEAVAADVIGGLEQAGDDHSIGLEHEGR